MVQQVVSTRKAIEWLRLRENQWREAAVPALKNHAQERRFAPSPGEGPLRLVFPVNRVDPCGGVRIILEYANRLVARGHHVTLVGHSPPPRWMPLLADYRQIPYHSELLQGAGPCDLIVATSCDQIPACVAMGQARVAYFEQGDFHLYDEVSKDLRASVGRWLTLADTVIAVSDSVRKALEERYAIPCRAVVKNGIDRSLFVPRTAAERAPGESKETPYLLVVGSDQNAFKRISDVIAAWRCLVDEGRKLDLVWVTAVDPITPQGRVVVAPSQAELVRLYQGASVLVSASAYESFSLPPLEAMACGTPVVTAANDGVRSFAVHEHNALVVPIGQPEALAQAIARVLDEPSLSESLRAGGEMTAARFDWEASIEQFEHVLLSVAGRRIDEVDASWTVTANQEDFFDEDGYQRLEGVLRETDASCVEVPQVTEVFPRHLVARWVPVASRAKGYGTLRLWAPVVKLEVVWPEGIELFRQHRYSAALDWFNSQLKQVSEADERITWERWVIMTAIEVGDGPMAISALCEALLSHPRHTDLWYLTALLNCLTGNHDTSATVSEAVELVGDATTYDEFFFSLARTCRAQLT